MHDFPDSTATAREWPSESPDAATTGGNMHVRELVRGSSRVEIRFYIAAGQKGARWRRKWGLEDSCTNAARPAGRRHGCHP